jgi:hypothetical protein
LNERPVRLVVSDDLDRGRASVFFRGLLAIPGFIWLGIWAIAAFPVAIVNWIVTLLRGRSPAPLHNFLARFVRYATHMFAYLNLAAQPMPGFDGRRDYPIDLEIDPPATQSRWTIFFRLPLALPALLLATILAGTNANNYTGRSNGLDVGIFSLLGVAVLLGWFFAVARARMPRGLRDAIAYALSYSAQFWAYLLLLTDRYPSSDPLTAISELPSRSDPISVELEDDLRRSRLTVFFRLPLAVPHFVVLTLWALLVVPIAIVSWLCALIVGRLPQPLHRFFAAYLRYQLHVNAFVCLVGNPFPGFTGAEGSYPIELHVAEPSPQGRWTVLFRLPLALPALLIANAYGALSTVVAVLGWFAALATGRMPVGLRNAGALGLRYTAQTYGYLLLLTSAYPYGGPCRGEAPAIPIPAAPIVTPAGSSPATS